MQDLSLCCNCALQRKVLAGQWSTRHHSGPHMAEGKSEAPKPCDTDLNCWLQPICGLGHIDSIIQHTTWEVPQWALHQSPVYLHAESEYCDDNFKHQSQGELPHGSVDSRASRSVRNVIHWPGHVWVIDVVAELGGLQSTAVIEELWDQLTGAPPGVRVGVGDDGSDGCYHNNFQDWVFPKPGGFSPPTPGNVAADKEGPPEATEDAKKDEGEELSHVPGGMVFHVEKDQSAISKRIDGSQCEGSHKSSEKWPPEGFQGKVIADLKSETSKLHWVCQRLLALVIHRSTVGCCSLFLLWLCIRLY